MIESTSIKIAVMQKDIQIIKDNIIEIKDKLENHYVTKEEFSPIQKIVYGMVTLIFISVLGAIVKLVLIK